MIFLGLDLAWGEGTPRTAAAETGVVALDESGAVRAASWTVGIDKTVEWVEREAGPDSILFVDAPLIVENAAGQRLCEKQVGQRYGRWHVSAKLTVPMGRWPSPIVGAGGRRSTAVTTRSSPRRTSR